MPGRARRRPHRRNSSRRGSNQARIALRCPTGATPPITNPVCARISPASALPSGSPASALALPGSTLLPPAVTKRTACRDPRRGRRWISRSGRSRSPPPPPPPPPCGCCRASRRFAPTPASDRARATRLRLFDMLDRPDFRPCSPAADLQGSRGRDKGARGADSGRDEDDQAGRTRGLGGAGGGRRGGGPARFCPTISSAPIPTGSRAARPIVRSLPRGRASPPTP
jgi:hypothetical protein